MKFVAQAIDLNLELTTLSGEDVNINGPQKINVEQASKILKKMEEVDKKIAANPSANLVLKEAENFLIDVYGKDTAFWTGNFEPALLMEIRNWFINQLAGIKKKG